MDMGKLWMEAGTTRRESRHCRCPDAGGWSLSGRARLSVELCNGGDQEVVNAAALPPLLREHDACAGGTAQRGVRHRRNDGVFPRCGHAESKSASNRIRRNDGRRTAAGRCHCACRAEVRSLDHSRVRGRTPGWQWW